MIRVLVNYSRSGGTLLARVLGAMCDVVLLSEVNPNQKHSYHYDLSYQMKEWYGAEIEGETFLEKMQNIYQWCQENGKTLVVRDVSAFDFMPNPSNAFRPTGELQLVKMLQTHFPIQTIAFVRDAVDVWISRDCPPLFSRHYLEYIQAVKKLGVPVFQYEAFCQNPSVELPKICLALNLVYDAQALEKWHFNKKVTGDLQMDHISRGLQQEAIAPLKRKRIARYLQKKADGDSNLMEANRLMDYPQQYDSGNQEEAPSYFWVELKFFLRRLLKRYPAFLE